MNKVQSYVRPHAFFDVNNEDHRRWVNEFQVLNSWKNCPVRFLIADEAGDLVSILQRKLLIYYGAKEFAKKA